ncbi:MAG: flavin monoamine oxidase family protein [Pyrinomonadaceae bacterium]
MSSEKSVLIIGAGAAGLAAARDLAVAGVKVILIEARDRIGGRIHTHHNSSIPVELGAEFVHGRHPQLLQAIEQSGSPLCDVTRRHWYFENGVLRDSHDFWNQLTSLMDLMNVDEPDRSFKKFLDSVPNDEAFAQARVVATRYVEGFHAADVNRIGVHGLIKANEGEDEVDGNHSFRILGGYDVVTETLLEQAQARGAVLNLNTILKELRWSRNQVEAVCIADKRLQRFSGTHALVTLPLGVLQAKYHQRGAVRFVPELPQAKQAAIEGIAMGQALRITLVFRERFWETLELAGTECRENLRQLGFFHHPQAPLPNWWTLLPVHVPMIVGWIGGPDAERFIGRGEDYAVEQALTSLQLILGLSEDSLRKLFVGAHTHDWGADPFARGAYAYLPVNGLEAQRTLAGPVGGTLFFAGEAMSVGHIGTVHGAIATGYRAAAEILEVCA